MDKEIRKTDLVSKGQVLELPSDPTHLGLNSDETILSVGVKLKNLPHLYLFDTRAFLNNAQPIKPFMEIPAITPPGTNSKC